MKTHQPTSTFVPRLAVAVAMALGAATTRAGTFNDDFSGGLSPYFNVTQTTAGLYNVNAANSNVRLAWAGTANPGGFQSVNVNLILPSVTLGGTSSIPGDFSASIDFANAALSGPGLNQVQLNLLFAGGTNYNFLDVLDNNSGGSNLNVHVYENQNNAGYNYTATTLNSGTFTVSRVGSTVTGYFNGTAIFSDSSISAAVQGINLSLQNNLGSNDATSVVFDNFSLTAANVVPEPGTRAAVAAGIIGLGLALRRRRRALRPA